MNAEPPSARFKMEHQPRRPGYAIRYAPERLAKMSHQPATYITKPFFQAIEGVTPTSVLSAWEMFKTGMRAVTPDEHDEEIYLYYINIELYDDVFTFGFYYQLVLDGDGVKVDENHQLSFDFDLSGVANSRNLKNQSHEFEELIEENFLRVENLEVFKALSELKLAPEISEGEP